MKIHWHVRAKPCKETAQARSIAPRRSCEYHDVAAAQKAPRRMMAKAEATPCRASRHQLCKMV